MKTARRKKGQTMVEYILIVVLIAISLIGIIGFFGKAIARKFTGATTELDEDAGQQAQDEYQDMTDGTKGKLKSLGEGGF